MQQVLGVVDALRHCHSVYIFGVGSSGITALDMKHKLMRIGLRGDAVSNNHFMYMQATLLKAGDVAMGVSHRAHRQKQCIHSDWPDRLAPPLSPLPIIWVLHYVKEADFCLINGNRQGMLQGDSIGTKAAQLFVFDLLYTLLVQSSPEQARESKLRTMNATDMTK